MNFFFKPKPGVVGDCIPFYANGRHHIFYLREFRDRDSYGHGAPWAHVSTVDFVHFEDHGEPFPRGSFDEQDYTTGTGCVLTDDSGTHHIFYTGINPYFRNDFQHEQALMHATSEDLDLWSKVPGQIWFPNEAAFERHDWRDPFVYKHPETERYVMLIAARLNHGPLARRGCTATLTSDDLINWSAAEPFYAPARFHGHECPDLFQMGDWWYLVFSEYGNRTVTRYVMSRSPDGPWTSPVDDQFDNRAFYAAKTSRDGSRRFLYGWNPSKQGNLDNGEWQWGGCLTVHEIVQRVDGALAVRMPPEAETAFGDPSPIRFESLGAEWLQDGDGVRIDAHHGYAEALGLRLPATCLIRGEIAFERLAGAAGVLLGMDDASGGSGYFVRFNPVAHRIEFGKVGGYRSWYVDRMPELDRPLDIRASEPIRFKIVVDASAVVAYVNDEVALSARTYGAPGGRCGVFADGTAISARRLCLAARRGDPPAPEPWESKRA